MATPADGIAYRNGTYCPLGEASVPLLDPGFTRGDAVYDTVSVWGGQFFRLDDLTAQDLHDADEAFLSSTAGGVMPVASVDGKTLSHGSGPGPISLGLRTEYWARREAGWPGTPVASLLRN